MSFKVKHMIFGKISIILSLCLVLNNTFMIKSYADESIASQNPLFIPITTFVTAAAIGSGMIAKNSEEAINGASQLIQNAIVNIKSNEVAKFENDHNYDSPFRVINGGQPEKPNNNNKNGKWVALAGGSLASNEIWANKEAIMQAMQEINDLNGYKNMSGFTGLGVGSEFLSQSSASNVSLQLAKYSNLCVTQFDHFLHSDDFLNLGLDIDKCAFSVNFFMGNILNAEPRYPQLRITVMDTSNFDIDSVVLSDLLRFNTYTNSYGSFSYIYSNSGSLKFRDSNNAILKFNTYYFNVNPRYSNESISFGSITNSKNTTEFAMPVYGSNAKNYPLCGYKWQYLNPWQLTNNVYNVNQTFDVNFPSWLQESINLLGQQIEGVRLGLQDLNIGETWSPTQEEIQSGTSPTSVIYQFINNYENPENIPEEEEEPDTPVVVPPAIEEPQPTNDYLGNFLLPESITTKFPFCIPFDIVRAFRLFSVSQREAPRWECDLNYGSNNYHVVIDLAMFNDVASFIRPLEFILFLVGLALGTRSLIRG